MCENGERYVVCMTQRVKILFARAFFYRDVLEKYLELYYDLNRWVYFGCCHIQHHAQTIHPTEIFIYMSMLQRSCVITWA
jgi:hypothetical protein